MKKFIIVIKTKKGLNSTMVRFKYINVIEEYHIRAESQFHYGSIQIIMFKATVGNDKLSQFHYGSIQMIE